MRKQATRFLYQNKEEGCFLKFDFSTNIDRHGKDSIAADYISFTDNITHDVVKEGFDVIPMWVADMAFFTSPAVTEAIQKRLQHSVFGYFSPSNDYYNAIINWHFNCHKVNCLKAENIAYENSVLGGVISAVNSLTSRGGSVLLNSPTYIGFTSCLTNNGYKIVLSPLVADNDGVLRMDLDDMEKKIVENNIHTAIFCSPHNPSGRVWERWELEGAMELFRKHDVFVVSDEIWSDIILFDNKHIPTQMISEDARSRTVALYAPTKTFNIAGLVGSYRIVYNKYLSDRITKESSLSHYNEMNVLSMHALIGAYSKDGREWVNELCAVLSKNASFACDYINNNFDGVSVHLPQGTYMLFLDCGELLKKKGLTVDALLMKGFEVGVIWQDGRPFHGDSHIRMNLALPHDRLVEALTRLKNYVFND